MESVLKVQNWVSSCSDIADIEFVLGGLSGGVVGKVIFMSNPTKVMLRWSTVVVEWGF